MRGARDRRPRVDVMCDADSHAELTIASFVLNRTKGWVWDNDLAMQGSGDEGPGGIRRWYSTPVREVLVAKHHRYDLVCPKCGLDLPVSRAKWEQHLDSLKRAGVSRVGLPALVATMTK